MVAAFDPAGSSRTAWSRTRLLSLLEEHPRPLDRTSYDPGHVTASGLVVSSDGSSVLLVLHRRLGRWLQPGGHLEPTDADIVAAARREVREETGIEVDPTVPPILVAVDVHEIPPARGEPAHLHHDLVFRFAAEPCQTAPSTEVVDAVWFAMERLDEAGVDDALRRAAERARTTLRPPGPPSTAG
jgi:8-oxo-dGTP pyrophosphatase MutT (NUDIX family)